MEGLSVSSNESNNDGSTASDNDGIFDMGQGETDQSGSGTQSGSEPNRRSNANGSARDLLSARPFVRGAKLWRDAGWLGTIPLPAKAKNPPPTGWTGRNAGFADNQQINDWAKLAQYKKGNIALHLGFPVVITDEIAKTLNAGKSKSERITPGEYEVVGIDVDDYEDNGKLKEGAKQLRALESQLGSLPRTYVSTARASRGDFNSGIRFYLVPRGLAFRGQVDKDIEVIQKSHRFAVVWPSYNPKSDSQYCLYHPDEFYEQMGVGSKVGGNRVQGTEIQPADGQMGGVSRGSKRETTAPPTPLHEIPHVTELPLLPEKWLDYLTNGKMLDADGGIDMESTPKEIEEWALSQFNDPDTMCAYTRKVTNKWKKLIVDEATSHDKIRNAHWELVNCGAEAHTGWLAGIDEIERHWIEDVADRQKRSLSELRGEVFREKINAFRKVKIKVEQATSAGGVYTNAECVCAQRASIANSGGLPGTGGGLFVDDSAIDDASPPDGLDHVSWGSGNSPDEYETNDDGNGEFLCDLLRYKNGRVKWVEGYGWIVWTDGEPGRPSRWLHDQDGLIRRAFWRVKRMQAHYAEQKYNEADQLWMQSGRITPMPADVKAAFAISRKWAQWAEKSGNERQAINAINAAKNFPGVQKDINELNQNPFLLGVANGVVELRTDGAYLRDAEASDYVTLNTGVEWVDWSGIPGHDIGKKMWLEYLDKFIPETRRADYQTILGHCILGGNPERLMLILLGGTSTGKSTMLRALGAAMGDYASTVTMTIFENHKLNPALANAMPKRMVFTSELSAGDQLSVAAVKRMTGNDVVKAELKGANVEIQGIPQYVPIMATNTAPEVAGADEALRRRLMALIFDQRIEDRKDEKRAAQELEEHASVAILAWLIEGYNMYCRLGIPGNVEIINATNEFASQLDVVNEFVGECVRNTSDSDHVSVDAMYAAFKSWCDKSNIDRRDIISAQKFSRRIKSLGIQQGRVTSNGKQIRAWVAVALTRKAELRSQTIQSVPELKLNKESDQKGK